MTLENYMKRKSVYNFVEELAISGKEYFHASDIKNNFDLKEEEIFQQITDLFNLGVIDIKYVIIDEEKVYDSLSDVPRSVKIDGERITLEEKNIFIRFYFRDEFLNVLNKRKDVVQ